MNIKNIDFTGLAIFAGIGIVAFLLYKSASGLSSLTAPLKSAAKVASDITTGFLPPPDQRQNISDNTTPMLNVGGSDISLLGYEATLPSQLDMEKWAATQGTDVYKNYSTANGTRTASGMDMIYF